MGIDEVLRVRFLIKPRNTNKKLVSSVINACINSGSRYREEDGFFTHPEQGSSINAPSGTLDDAINALSKNAGMLWMHHSNIYDYSLSISPQKYRDIFALGRIELGFERWYFEQEDKARSNSKILIKIVKSIWNALDEKPIYGYGDAETWLPYAINDHPNDDDVLALNIPVNHFWLNFYGKEIIAKFGKEKLTNGAHSVEELDKGLLVITDIVPKSYQRDWGKTPEQIMEESNAIGKSINEYLKKRKRERK